MNPAPTPVQTPGLPLDFTPCEEPTLEWAYHRSGVDMPFEAAIANPVVGGCLRNAVHAALKSRARRHKRGGR